MKKRLVLLVLMIILPFLLSLSPSIYHSNYYAKYTSPEGIHFLSYSKEWNQQKLQQLYHELLTNKHGKELSLLREIRIWGGSMRNSPYTTGRFNVLTNTIDLFHGDKFITPSIYQKTLSHEYGHFFTYHYLKTFHFPFSTWAKLRGLEHQPVHWDAFWNYRSKNHHWYPQEIMAEDYVLLYGATKKVEINSNEAFYLRTQHDNQQLSNILENKKLQQYLEAKTGIKIDQSRLLATPKLTEINANQLIFLVTKRKNICYRLNLIIYENNNGVYKKYDESEQFFTTTNSSGKISFSFPSYSLPMNGYIEATIDVLDLNTSIGFQTKPIFLSIKNNEFTNLLKTKPAN